MRAALDARGTTEPVQFELETKARAFALRVSPAADSGGARCYALHDVVVNDAEVWISEPTISDYGDYCTGCAQRVSVGSGYGFFVLPSAAEAPEPVYSVRARVGLRDCATLTPATAGSPDMLQVELASWQPPAAEARLRLPLAVVVATQHGLARDAELLPAALRAVKEIWKAAKIDVELEPHAVISPPAAAIEFSAVDRAALVQLEQRARQALGPHARDPRWPLVILGTCLRRKDVILGGQSEPWAYTAHLPGGSAVGDAPDAIFVAAERCEGLEPGPRFNDAAQLGAVLAHELGHYLGLYHVVEVDGRQDALSDTSADDANLMRASPLASSTSLSAGQISIARRHNAFARSPDSQP